MVRLSRIILIMVVVVVVASLGTAVSAQVDLFDDNRLDQRPAIPVITFCRTDGGLEAFTPEGGEVFSVSQMNVETALAQAFIEKTSVQVAIGANGARLLAYPDGVVALFAQDLYKYNLAGSDCGGYAPDYSLYVEELVEDVANIEAESSTSVLASGSTHVVQPGENLFRIGLRYGVNYTIIARANGLSDPTRIYSGQVLTIP